MLHPAPQLPLFTRAVSLWCALMVWMLGVLAYSPELHGHVHADSSEPQHECAVTLFSQGAENPAPVTAATLAAPMLRAEGELRPAEVLACGVAPVRLPPACGPPLR